MTGGECQARESNEKTTISEITGKEVLKFLQV